VDIRQTPLWSKYLKDLGWTAEKLSFGYTYSKTVPLLGSTVKIPRAKLPVDFYSLENFIKKTNAFMVKIEPDVLVDNPKSAELIDLFEENGFHRDGWTLNPSKTIQIDLTRSQEELLTSLEKDTRYNIHLAERKGVKVKQTDNFDELKNLYLETARRKGFWPAKQELQTLWEVFSKEKSATILTAFYENKPIASTLLLFTEKLGQYQHAASLDQHRNVMAPYLLLWESVKFLKKKGCTVFDLEGLYDSRYKSTKNWKGFSLFKTGFGGEEVEYLGSFVKYPKIWSKLLFLLGKVF